jgi:DNA polymerase-1
MKPYFKVKFQTTEYDAAYITEYSAAILALNNLSGASLIGIDTETKPKPEYRHDPQAGLSAHLGEISLVQMFDGTNAYVIDMEKVGKEFVHMLVRFLERERFVAHYALFDLQFFMQLGVKTMNIGCTQILTRLLYHAMYPTDDGLSAKLADVIKIFFKEDIVKTLQTSDWGAELTFEQVEYAALDAVAVYKLAEKLVKGLNKFGLERIYKLTREAQFPIAAMQINGFKFNVERHKTLIQQWRNDLYEARKELVELTGMQSFNSHSIAEWLEKNLTAEQLEIWPRTESGKLATDAHVFADFSYLPIVKPFSKFQKAQKLTQTYGQPLVNMINEATGRLHPRFNLCGARTGRLSCSQPNLQQAPRDKDFRSCFIPDKENMLVRADFNQIEIRVAAELSRDEMMLKAYREGIDIHALTASQVSKKKLTEVTDAERQMAKAINFGFMFGLGAKKFAHYAKKSYKVEVTEEQAYDAVDTFRTTYEGYREWQLKQSEAAGKSMAVRTPCGKLRMLHTDNCYGASMNTPVQGGAAECMLYSLVFLYHAIIGAPELGAKIVNCVHDEIIVECPEENVGAVSKLVELCMTDGFLAVFPQGITRGIVAVSHGRNWSDAK